MRIAIVSDIHGNFTALEAVIADLRETSPDLTLQGGDLADGGVSPAEVVDRIRELGWPGVAGNADEMLWRPEALEAIARGPVRDAVEDIAMWTRERLGDERLEWLRGLPRVHLLDEVALVHASPADFWRCPGIDATDQMLRGTYESLGRLVTVYGHLHRPFVRKMGELIVANSGSVSLSYTGQARASYLLLDDGEARVRFVEYDVRREIQALLNSTLPHAEWIAAMLETASFQMP